MCHTGLQLAVNTAGTLWWSISFRYIVW